MTKRSGLILLALLLHFYSWAAADVVSQNVTEGNNFTISIKLPKLDTDPQFLFTFKGALETPLAQLTCQFLKCSIESYASGLLLHFNEENVTLVLLNVTHRQSGLYKVTDLSSKSFIDMVFNISVYEPPPKPPSMHTEKFQMGIGASLLVVILIVILVVFVVVVIALIFYKCKKRSGVTESQTRENEMMMRYRHPSGQE